MRIIVFILGFCVCFCASAEVEYVYKGAIGKYPITMTIFGPITKTTNEDLDLSQSDGNVASVKLAHASEKRNQFINNIQGYYFYDKYRKPIFLRGTWGDRGFTLNELDEQGNTNARFWIDDFSLNGSKVDGVWRQDTTQLPVNLTFDSRSTVQSSLVNEYEVLLTVRPNETAIKVYTDKDSQLVQIYDGLDCTESLFDNPDNIKIDDYNFDGYSDFVVTCHQYAQGISQFFMLFNPSSQQFVPTKMIEDFSLDKINQHLVVHQYCDNGTQNKYYKWEKFYFDIDSPVIEKCLSYGSAQNKTELTLEECGC